MSQALGAAVTTYACTPGTNWLSSITAGSSTTPVGYIPTGNISPIPPTTGAPVATLSYNPADRLSSIAGTVPAITGMIYDAFGQRLSKTDAASNSIYYTYDQNGRFAALSNPN